MRHEKLIVPDRGAAEPISAGAALLAGKKVAPDALNLLMLDHQEAMAFFERCLASSDPAEKLSVGQRLCLLLSAHMQVEEEILYPAAEQATGDKGMVDHAREEHNEAKVLVRRILERTSVDDGYDASVAELKALIGHHVAEEESSFFPKVRQTDLDLYEIGRRVAARRVELVFELTGAVPKEGPMQTSSQMDVATTGNLTGETGARAIDPGEARKLFVVGLQNAHAAEQDCRTMMRRQVERLENYPKLKARLEQHLVETEMQIQRLDQILEGLGESASTLKDTAGSIAANMGAMMNAAAGDEVLKNSLANAAMAQFEIAAYRALLVMGEAAGEVSAIKLLQQSLSEERAMAAWLEENLPGTVIGHLHLRSQGETAKH